MTERFVRPSTETLPESAVVPEQNLLVPAPNQFTHTLARRQPFYYRSAQQTQAPDGELAAGAPVVLLVYDGGRYCRVADGRGLYVEVEHDALAAGAPEAGTS